MNRMIGWVIALFVLGAMAWGMATHTLMTIAICAVITGTDKAIKQYKNKKASI